MLFRSYLYLYHHSSCMLLAIQIKMCALPFLSRDRQGAAFSYSSTTKTKNMETPHDFVKMVFWWKNMKLNGADPSKTKNTKVRGYEAMYGRYHPPADIISLNELIFNFWWVDSWCEMLRRSRVISIGIRNDINKNQGITSNVLLTLCIYKIKVWRPVKVNFSIGCFENRILWCNYYHYEKKKIIATHGHYSL